MNLIETIKKAQIEARKNKDVITSATLTTLIGEAEMIGKNDGNRPTTDAEVVAIVKKFIKNIDETLSVLSKAETPDSRVETLTKEKEILSAFLPKQLSESDLREAMKCLVVELGLEGKGPKGMGQLMKELKTRFEGQYDGGLASKLSKEVLG